MLHLASPAAMMSLSALSALDGALGRLGLGPSLLELVKLRASQINGCACRGYHHALAAWRETPAFTPRERAALGWTEARTRLADTRIADTHTPDADHARLAAHFTPAEQVDLTLACALINRGSRFATGFRKLLG